MTILAPLLPVFVVAAIIFAALYAYGLQPREPGRQINWLGLWLVCATLVAAVLLL